ncbi:hypothetical protein BVRB_6g141550 [Beta vulgaris subsp. vulgaris]|nr:hypothetical protein BVRB_6g141550 [Beta vulgaris subsp. vulgaris]
MKIAHTFLWLFALKLTENWKSEQVPHELSQVCLHDHSLTTIYWKITILRSCSAYDSYVAEESAAQTNFRFLL